MKISLYGASNRSHRWLWFYNFLKSNSVEFEVIFVGPYVPKYVPPSNMKFIQTNVKTAQCWEIGSRHAKGELILPFADDCEFSPGLLDNMYKTYHSQTNKHAMVCAPFHFDGKSIPFAHYHHIGNKKSPRLSICGLFSKESYRKLGGIDKRFTSVQWDTDIGLRFVEVGGMTILTNGVCNEHSGGSSLHGQYGSRDKDVLNSFWFKDGEFQKKRLSPVMPFNDKDILTKGQ